MILPLVDGVEAAHALMAQYIKLEITMMPVGHLLASVELLENALVGVVPGLTEKLHVHQGMS